MRAKMLGKNAAGIFLVTLNAEEQARLRRSCFRPGAVCAGNFIEWQTFEDVVFSIAVKRVLLEHASTSMIDGDSFSCTIDVGRPIGWSGTAPLESFARKDIERFRINKRAHGFRMRENVDRLAPLTALVTIVFEMIHTPSGQWLVLVHSLYPGPDVGDMEGNVSRREGVTFFHPETPGEPLPTSASPPTEIFHGPQAQQ